MSDNYSPALGGDLAEDPKTKRKHAWRKRPLVISGLVGIDMSQEEYEQHREQWLTDHPGDGLEWQRLMPESEIPPIIRASISGVDLDLHSLDLMRHEPLIYDDSSDDRSHWVGNQRALEQLPEGAYYQSGGAYWFPWLANDDEEAKNE